MHTDEYWLQRIENDVKETGTFFFLKHDNAKLHTSLKTREHIAKRSWTHPPYSPDLAPSNIHIFGLMKDILRG